MNKYRIGFGNTLGIVFDHESDSQDEKEVLEQAHERLQAQLEGGDTYRLSKWGELKHANLYFNNLTPEAMYIEDADTEYVPWERKKPN